MREREREGGGQILPDIKMEHKSGKWTFFPFFHPGCVYYMYKS